MAEIYGTSSDKKSASSQILSIGGTLLGIDVLPPTTGQAVLVVYDSENSTTTGKIILAECHVDAGMPSLNHEFVRPLIANRGIYCTLTGTGAEYLIRYTAGI